MPAWWIPSWLIIRFTHARAANNIFALLYLSSHTQINSTFNYVRGEKLDIQVSIMNIRVFRAKRKDKNVLAIAQNMNNYIQNEIRAKNVAMSMKFTVKYRVCLSMRFDLFVRLREDTRRYRGFPWLSSKSAWMLAGMFISIVEMYPNFRFRYLGHLAQGRLYESVGENSSQKYGVESGRCTMPNYEREKAVKKM